MSKKLTHNKIHRGAPSTEEDKSQIVAAVENITSSTKSKVKRNRTPLIILLVLVVLGILATQILQVIKANQEDELWHRLSSLASSSPDDSKVDDRITAMDKLLADVKGQPKEKIFYQRMVGTLLKQADPAASATPEPFSITAVTATSASSDDAEADKKKMLEKAGEWAQAAANKFQADDDGDGKPDLEEWNKKIQSLVSENADDTWLHKPRSYRLLSPESEAPSKQD